MAEGGGASGSGGGWTLVLLLLLGALAYLGGGVLYKLSRGQPAGVPHVRFWNNLLGLVLDGIHFVTGKGQAQPYQAVTGGAEGEGAASDGVAFSKGAEPTPFVVGAGTTVASSKGAEETPFIIGPGTCPRSSRDPLPAANPGESWRVLSRDDCDGRGDVRVVEGGGRDSLHHRRPPPTAAGTRYLRPAPPPLFALQTSGAH